VVNFRLSKPYIYDQKNLEANDMRNCFTVLIIVSFLFCPVWAKEVPQKKDAKAPAAKTATPVKPPVKPPVANKTPPPPPPPSVKVEPYKAFIVVEAETGIVIEGENVHQKCWPASITKLMLGSVVLDKLKSGQIKLDDKVTVSPDASSMGGSQVYLKPGEVFSLDELMRAVMVASANDAAYAVAEFVAGSRNAFVDMMNEKAHQLNMVDSKFESMHGLPPAQNQEPDVSSPYDLAILGRELVKDPQLLAWTSLKTEPFRDGTLVMRNHNNLMNRFSGMDGLKTGFYREAGYSIVATAKRNDLRLIAVVMGSSAAKLRDSVVDEKLKKAFGQYEMVSVVKQGDTIDKEIALPDGKQKTVKPIAASGFSYPLARDKKKLLTKNIDLPDQIKGEIKQGQRMGEMVINFNNGVVGKVDLVSPVDVAKRGFFSRIFN
jgi:D-alanyl-D-alanine carboxypeptidase (penicillin-binding protein 5/6)